MAFSIIIPSRNIDNLKACVGAIRACGETAQIIVVWDRDQPYDGDQAKVYEVQCAMDDIEGQKGGATAVFQGECPFIFSRNINFGIRAVNTDDVLLLNDDALLVGGHGFSRMAEAAERHQYVGVWSAAVMGKAVNPVHVHVPTYSQLIAFRTVRHMVPFVAVYIRRAVIDKVGLLEERFCGTVAVESHGSMGFQRERQIDVYGGEDDDYCYRVRQAGLKIAVHNRCVVEHGTLPSKFRPDGKGRSIEGAKLRFQEIHGFPMGSR